MNGCSGTAPIVSSTGRSEASPAASGSHPALEVERLILELCEVRGPDKTICPSEIARRASGEAEGWRDLMPTVREVAGRLARAGRIRISQRGRDVDPRTVRGPIRLGLRG